MPKVDVYDIKGKKVSDIELAESVFGIEPNENIVHAVLVNYLANQRQGTQSTKTRAEVRGGGRKPWRQKGTGRARQGSIRAPQWIKGGIALGPKPRSYKYTVNKKERRLAIKSILSSKVLEKELTVVDKLELKEIKTKSMVKEGEYVVTRVINYGRIIPKQELDHIFQKFYRTEQSRSRDTGGTGLGLAIVQQIAELHHGQVRVKSDLQGTVFEVELPVGMPKGKKEDEKR